MRSASSLLLTAFSQTCSVAVQTACPRLPAAEIQSPLATLSTIGHLHLLQGLHLISGSFLALRTLVERGA